MKLVMLKPSSTHRFYHVTPQFGLILLSHQITYSENLILKGEMLVICELNFHIGCKRRWWI